MIVDTVGLVYRLLAASLDAWHVDGRVERDADITILDPTKRGKIRKEDLHESDYSPWEGHDIFAWPVVTILRGKVMVESGRYFGSASDGRYLKRKISQKTLRGAAL